MGLALLAPLAACGGGEFPELDGAASAFTLALEVEPAAELEVGRELTLTLSLFHEGDPLTGVAPDVVLDGPVMGTLAVAPGAEPGTFVGTHTFDSPGTYTVKVRFTADGSDRELQTTLVIRTADEH